MHNLPFIAIVPSRIPPRSFWHVSPAGNVWKDEETGFQYADALLAHLRTSLDVHLVGWIVQDMTGVKLDPAQIAFFERIALECCRKDIAA